MIYNAHKNIMCSVMINLWSQQETMALLAIIAQFVRLFGSQAALPRRR